MVQASGQIVWQHAAHESWLRMPRRRCSRSTESGCERQTWNIARPTFSRGHHRPGLTWCLFHFGCPTFQRGDFDEFWANMRRGLKPAGSVFVVDSLLEPTSTARDDHSVDRSGVVRRKLNDGREFQIVKVFYEPSELESRLAALGWSGWLHSTGKFFLYGLVERTDGNERNPASR